MNSGPGREDTCLSHAKMEQMTTFVALDLSSPGSMCESLTSLFSS